MAQCEDFESFSGYSVAQWYNKLSESPKLFLRKIKRFCKTPFANMVSSWAQSESLKIMSAPLVCYFCGNVSSSFQAHSVHLASSHGIKCKFRKYVDGPVCRVCLKNFDTRDRCLNHAKKSLVCKLNLLCRGPCIDEEEAKRLDDLDKSHNVSLYRRGRRSNFAEFPVIQCHGPLLPVIQSRPSTHHVLGFGYNRL